MQGKQYPHWRCQALRASAFPTLPVGRSGFHRPPVGAGAVPLPPITPWPRQIYSVPMEVDARVVPAAQNFQYVKIFKIPQDLTEAAPRLGDAEVQALCSSQDPNEVAFSKGFPVKTRICSYTGGSG